MKYPRAFCASVAFMLCLLPAVGQEGRVIVEKPGGKELKRAAHRLHIPADQLRNARAALQEATDLSRRLDAAPASVVAQLGDSWIQINRAKAPAAVESLYTLLRASASKASDLSSYQQATSGAQQLLFALAELDSDKATQLIHQWPDPPTSLGEDAAKLRNQLDTQFQNQMVQRMTYRDPAAALKMLPALTPSGLPDYGIRGQLALQLMRTGQKDEAVQIADQVIADFQQRTPDQRTTQEYTGFLQNLSMLDPDRFQDAFAALPPMIAKQTTAAYPTVIQIGNQTLEVSPAENAVLNMLRGMSGRPELALKTLDGYPDLKEKLNRIGGLDNFLSPGGGSMNAINYSGPGRAMIGSVRPYAASRPAKDPVFSLFTELRGKAGKDPGSVRAKLEEVASNPEMVEPLINLAQRANYEDPDLGSIALEVAAAHLSQVEPLQRRASVLQSMVSAYRNCEGEVDTGLLRDGFVIADKLRQDEEKKNPDMGNRISPYGTQADQLEATLVSEYARDNFDAAMSYLRAKPDNNVKLMMYQRVVQAMRFGY